MLHLITLYDWSTERIRAVLDLADEVKRNPAAFERAMHRKVLLMIFEKPSLRTRLSFETGMCQMGGDAIYYDTSTSPLGAGKETIEDMVRVASRYVDLIMARLYEHSHIEKMAAYASVPVINALTNFAHPCQILADLQTIREKKGGVKGLTLAYFGDSNNNVTHSLMYGGARMGMHVRVACPDAAEFRPQERVLSESRAAAAESGGSVEVVHDAPAAARGADVLYTDSWMSYHVKREELEPRVRALTPFQVHAGLMDLAARDAIFMNCLPAMRGYEQTADIIDGPHSVVFDQAENRLHAQKAVMLMLHEHAASVAGYSSGAH